MTIKEERKDWIGYVKKLQKELPEHGLGARSEDHILALMYSNVGNDPMDAPGIENKLDGVARMVRASDRRALGGPISHLNLVVHLSANATQQVVHRSTSALLAYS
jgi:hypothetical protein